jgi:hypothetical protein
VAHGRVELTSRAHDVCLRAALVGEPKDATDVVERQFLSVVKQHHACFERVERFKDETPVATAAFFHFEGFVDGVGAGVRKLGRLRLRDPYGFRCAALHSGDAAVPRDHVEPRGEAAIAAILVEVAIGAQQDFLREVSGGLTVVREACAPARNAALMAYEQFVGGLFPSARTPALPIGVDQGFIR